MRLEMLDFALHEITGKYRRAIDTKLGVASIVFAHILVCCIIEVCCFAALEPSETRTSLSLADTQKILNFTITPSTYYYGAAFSYPGPNGVEIYDWKMIIATGIGLAVYGAMYLGACVIGIRLYLYAISPFLWEFIPGFVVLLGGLFGVPHNWGLCATVFMAGYSTSDAVLSLLLFKAYRRRMADILLRGNCLGRRQRFVTNCICM
ncbi:unnamed protein product, partial [Mesorhabditis spiculigera]